MALHQIIQRLLLVGVRLEKVPTPPQPRPPQRLLPLIASLAADHQIFDQRAIHFGHRYRSGYWAIYLLSAIAVLCAVLPLALGWDSPHHALHPFSGLWAVAEVLVIGTVSAIYWQGQRRDWQGQWLRARMTAELTAYLPLIAPLLDFSRPATQSNWYQRVLDPGQHLLGAEDVAALCTRHEPLARELLLQAWTDSRFVASYAQWTIETLQAQQHYHERIAIRQHALLHRVHGLTTWLFGLTALAALTHLVVHTIWLSVVTTFLPALGASLHGALAQSEAYRLGATSERLALDLQTAILGIRASMAAPPGDPVALKAAVKAAIALILDEHQDWHTLVSPHRLLLP